MGKVTTVNIALIAAILVLGALVLSAAYRLSLVHLVIPGIPMVLLGSTLLPGVPLVDIGEIALALLVLLVAYFTVSRFVSEAGSSWTARYDGCLAGEDVEVQVVRRVVFSIVLLVTVGTIYHFAVAGVPIFSGSVETARFDSGRSGLLGIPSRLYLYGTFIALATAVSGARICARDVLKDGLVRWAGTVLLLSRLVSGFKGALIEVAFTVVLLALLLGVRVSLYRYFKVVVSVVVASSLVVFLVANQYATYEASGRSLSQILVERATVETARPSVGLMDLEPGALGDSRSIIEVDYQYFTNRYFGIGNSVEYSFVRLYAAYLYNVPPREDVVIQPVTTGALPELYYDLGNSGMLVGAAILGAFLAAVERRANKAQAESWCKFASFATLCQLILDYLSKGGIVYLILNWVLTLLVCVAVGLVVSVISRSFLISRSNEAVTASREELAGSSRLPS